MVRKTAVFDEREGMQAAVRELVASGVPRERILVAPTGAVDPEARPRSMFGLTHRAHYAGMGAALGMLLGVAVSSAPGGPTLTTLWLVIVGAMLGGMLGGMVGMIVGASKKERWRQRTAIRRWAVRVDLGDEEASDIVAVLTRHGGRIETVLPQATVESPATTYS